MLLRLRMNGDYGTRAVCVCVCVCNNEKEEEDNDRFYEVNPLLDSQPGGKINTEPSSSSSFLNRQNKKKKK